MANEDPKDIAERWGKRNLENNYITTLAAAQWGTPEDYGKILNTLYDQTVTTAPNQETWNTIALDMQPNGEYGDDGIMSEGGVISKGAFKARSANTLIRSLSSIKVADALKYAGASGKVEDKYKDKYVHELDQEQMGALIGGYVKSTTHQRAAAVLEAERKAIAGNLEKMFNPEPAPSSGSNGGSTPKNKAKKKSKRRPKAK
jgi:hypothetical protein